ncbi:MAG: site-specific tyrosine recombinase XerC [Nocardioidaceae bacterium]
MTAAADETHDAHGLAALVGEFCEWPAIRNYSPRTIGHYRSCLDAFTTWAAERGVTAPGGVSLPVLEGYQRALFYRRKPDGSPLSTRAQAGHLVAVRALFRWAARHRRIAFDPAAALELPRMRRLLPRGVLDVAEVETVLAQPDVSTPEGVRDRAIMETLYSTAMRGQEAAGLALTDVDFGRGTVFIRAGKGARERVVPIADRALGWVDRYVLEARPQLVVPPDRHTLFLTTRGQTFTTKRLGNLVRPYVDAAGITKPGACHLFRHTAATLMLEGGADLRYVQELLGHADISTTTIYTRVSIRQLKAVHTACHPGAKTAGRSPSLDRDGDDAIAAHLDAWLADELATELEDLDPDPSDHDH